MSKLDDFKDNYDRAVEIGLDEFDNETFMKGPVYELRIRQWGIRFGIVLLILSYIFAGHTYTGKILCFFIVVGLVSILVSKPDKFRK